MQILSAKLLIPPLRSKPVSRQRLFQKLDQGMEQGFVLVSAPAGYGKSTLISAWLRGLKSPGVWLSLDDGDNDPARFTSYLAAAFGRIDPALGDILEQTFLSHSPTGPETLLTPLINLLTQVHHPICLVLDDYQVIQNQDVQRLVGCLLEHRPPALRLVIVTRADPPLPLARLRARSEMVEIRQVDLRFTPQEASDFLNRTMGLSISLDDAARITTRTEGWIAGLQMAALSMQNVDDIPGFIDSLSGSHRFIFDYLLDEILEGESPEIRRFLLCTSILQKFTTSLCDALIREDTEIPSPRSSTIILEALERNNLFILPMDHDRRWFRYHILFGELLRGYLLRTDPGLIPILHSRASAWFEKNGMIADAIQHSLASGEWERVIQLISANVFALLEQNELSVLARKLDTLTGLECASQSWLWLGRAWLAAYTGQISAVEPFVKKAEDGIDSCDREENQCTLRGQCAAIRAFSAWIAGEYTTSMLAAQDALQYLDSSDWLMRCQSATVLGLSSDEIDDRSAALQQALNYAQKGSISHVTIFAHGCWAYHLVSQGKLREAYAACKHAIKLAQSEIGNPPLPTLSHVYSTLSMIYLERDDLDQALEFAREAVALAHRWEQADALHFAYTNLGNALFAQGELEEAFQVLHLEWQIARRTSLWFERITLAQEVDWNLALGNLGAVYKLLDLTKETFEEGVRAKSNYMLQMFSIQFFLVHKEYARGLAWIKSLLERIEKRKTYYYMVRILAWQALMHFELNQETLAINSLEKALLLAVPEGFVRSFMVGGAQMIALLHRARTAGLQTAYLDKLLACMEPKQKHQPPKLTADSHLIEALSDREMEVLNLLARGFTDKKIAETLVIARETVHKHLKNIYEKLDVHSRTEAVALAQKLNLLKPH